MSFQPMLHFLFLILTVKCYRCYGADAISGDEYISGDKTLISKQAKFELGFFQAGQSSNFYIGIWYKKISKDGKKTIGWVANRETPVKDKYFSFLGIQDADLLLFNESQDPIWSTNVDFVRSSPVVAILCDEGNFALIEVSSNSTIWESFDHPTDTWLPGAKLAYNKITGNVPWRYLDLRENAISRLCSNNINFSWGANETYLTYNLINPETTCRLVMEVSGKMKAIDSESEEICGVIPNYCREFGVCNVSASTTCSCLAGFKPKSDEHWRVNDFSGCCKRKVDSKCVDGSAEVEKTEFMEYLKMIGPKNSRYVRAWSVAECESRCLNSCSCTAYAYDGGSTMCSILDDTFLNLMDHSSSTRLDYYATVFVKLAASEYSSGRKNKSATVIRAVGCITVAFVLLVVTLFVFWFRGRRMGVVVAAEDSSLAVFNNRDLQNATKNFSHKLGAGGFGSVFKGILPDSSFVAVKKLESVGQGEKQFRAEISTIGTKQHINLVRLRGFCSQGANKLLVYEYLENKSLDCHLFSKDDNIILNWNERYQIALGTARGLAYLHESYRDVIIQCDIKPENIILDADFCPKVADFGLGKLMGRNFSRVLTTMRGTRGYMAPEWLSGVAITPKADVYSFGMMAFELISGNQNLECSEEGFVTYFPSSAAEVMVSEGDMLSVGIKFEKNRC